jgi:N utilization substance protein A
MANKEPEMVKAECEQVQQLFERYVPEIARGSVLIKAMAREPGRRTKVTLQSVDPGIDAVRVCVGKVRNVESDGASKPVPDGPIKAIVDELNGERIDLVGWSDSLQTLISRALMPAKVEEVSLYPTLGRAIVRLKEDQLGWAIGPDGINVRLATKLSGWDIELMTQAELEEAISRAENWFRQIPGATDKVVEICIKEGFLSYDDLTFLDAAQLANLTGVTAQHAAAMLSFAEEAAQRVEAETRAKMEEDHSLRHAPGLEEVTPGALQTASGVVLVMIGIVVVLGGFVLYLGNRTGLFPTFPFAGYITILAGAVLVAIGLSMAGFGSRPTRPVD